jgi:hypothetical protein
MADPRLMDRLFQRIMRGLIDSGVAPHYAELGRALGLSVEEGRQVLLEERHSFSRASSNSGPAKGEHS